MIRSRHLSGTVCIASLLLLLPACSEAPVATDDSASDSTEEEKIEQGAQTLEDAANKAMQIEIDALNEVVPEPDQPDEDAATDDDQ